MNINNSQTRRTSESIFLPGESRSPVRLDALRVLGLRLFIVLLKSKSLRKQRSLTRPHEETTTIAGYNCIGRFYRRFAIVREDSNFANDVNRGTKGSTTTPLVLRKFAESANQVTPNSISLCQNNKGIHL